MNTDLRIDFANWGKKLMLYWWIFAIGIFLAIPAGQLYLRYSTPLYSSQAKLLIKDVGTQGGLSEAEILTEGFGINASGKDMDNEIQILKSRPIITNVIERLKAHISYYRIGRIKNTELYGVSPILLDLYMPSEEGRHFSFYIKVGYYNNFEFRVDKEEPGEEHNFGETFTNEFGEFRISRNEEEKVFPGIYMINISRAEDVANYYKQALVIEVVGKQGASGILELKIIDPSPEKAKDFINMLIDVYNEDQILDNTQVLKNTIQFIDRRIGSLTAELNSIESDIERFKSENDIITKTAGESLDYTLVELRSSLGKLSSYEIEKDVLNSLEENLMNNEDDLIPSNISSTNSALGGLIQEYNSLFLERKKLLKSVSEESFMVVNLENKLIDIKSLLITTLKSVKEDLKIPQEKTEQEIGRLKKSLTGIPSVEKKLLEKLRMQTIKENLFLFLLQKKEETELSNAVAVANTRIIESALSSESPIFPQRKLTLLASILLGIFLPLIIVVILILAESTIDSEELVKNLSSVPIIGRISKIKSGENIFLKRKERTVQAEMYKLLRTNLNYTNIEKKQQVLAITSSSTGEGKSVTAINLALTISFSGKKVVLLDMDLRKPKIAEYIGGGRQVGITDYLTNNHELKDIINQYEDNPLFNYITSGPIPPNPSELIMSERMRVLIDELKKEYDYIIMDSPPVGVVSDALLLREFITNTLYMVRHKYTKKKALKYLEEMYAKGELINPFIIINDIKRDSSYGGYISNYGSNYYLKED